MKLFVHIPKNAGCSVRALNQNAFVNRLAGPTNLRPGLYDQVTEVMTPLQLNHGVHHARWRDFDPKYTSCNTAFAIVRNPWSRVVSRFTYLKKLSNKPDQHITGIDFNCSFDHFLDSRFLYGNREFFWFRAVLSWFPQREYVIDDQGQIRCDILRFEHSEDMCKYLNLEQFPHSNKSGPVDYRKYYTAATYDIIADWYREDIETFGFTFDGPATKNIWGIE